MRMLVLVVLATIRDYLTLKGFPLTSCFVYGMESEGKSPQLNGNSKKKMKKMKQKVFPLVLL